MPAAAIMATVLRIRFDPVLEYVIDFSSSGSTIANVTLRGTGIVNSDCTGTLIVGVYASAGNLVRTATFDVVYVDNAREGLAIVTSLVLANGTTVPAVLTVNAKKLFHELPHER